ncbi:MAG TPA: DUF1638 domain-containing protein [Acidimicrobiia bacterium]
MKAGRVLIIACGALARELSDVLKTSRMDWVDIECLPAVLHNTPKLITDAVRERLDRARGRYDKIFVGYADCGTGGMLDRLLEERGIERLPGAHCYEFFAGANRFAQLHEEDPATFYLTDFLAKHFDRLVWQGLGLDRWPQLRDDYFGNYRRVIYLSQVSSDVLVAKAREAAAKLGLAFEHHHVGYGDFQPAVSTAAGSAA